MRAHRWTAGHPAPEDPPRAVDCHRRLAGPYTGLAALLRAVTPEAVDRDPGLAALHAITLHAIIPDLAVTLAGPPHTLTEDASPEERTRLYSPDRTSRLAHGAIDLLQAWAASRPGDPPKLTFLNVDEADPTDVEFLTLLLRRTDPEALNVTLHTRSEALPAPLETFVARTPDRPSPTPRPGRSEGELARAFVAGDCLSSDPAERAAYQRTDQSVRTRLHDARATELEGLGQGRLGAFLYHLERGSDSARAGDALLAALNECVFRGFYHAARDIGHRARVALDPEERTEDHWFATARTAMCHTVLGEVEESLGLHRRIRENCTLPRLHMISSYATAMLHTRFLPPDRRDHALARAHVNTAIAIAELWPDPEARAFHSVFNQNGKALIEMNDGEPARALELVSAGIERLDRELPGDAQLLHRSVLLHNRAQLLARMGRLEEALAGFDAAIVADPNHPEYHSDKAATLRRQGDLAGAEAEYGEAIRLTPPFWQLHHNRAGVRLELGDSAGGLADLARVNDLAPDQLEPWSVTVGLLLQDGRPKEAEERIRTALTYHPGDPSLLCLLGSLLLDEGVVDAAALAFEAALSTDGECVEALANRAAIAFDLGDHEAAVADLTAALKVTGPDPDLHYNRARALLAAGRPEAALDDCAAALGLHGADEEEFAGLRAECLALLPHREPAS